MVMIVFLLRRLPTLSPEEFHHYWRVEHRRLVEQHAVTLGMRRYSQLHTLDTPLGELIRSSRGCEPADFDGVALVWFDSLDAARGGDDHAGGPGCRRRAPRGRASLHRPRAVGDLVRRRPGRDHLMASYEAMTVEHDGGISFVTIDHPPVNLLDATMLGSLWNLANDLAEDESTRVVVVRSANPEFFIAHADLHLIQALPRDRTERGTELEFIHVLMERWRTLPQVTIAQLEGRARGGGSEFALSLDLRFAALGTTFLSQPEVAIGIIPGGGGTQRLPRLIGRSRALEVVLGCEDFPADLAERYGYVNRAFPPDELAPFVARLANRMAAFPPRAIRLAKEAVDAASGSIHDGLLDEAWCFNRSMTDPDLDARIGAALDLGAQTRAGELELGKLLGPRDTTAEST